MAMGNEIIVSGEPKGVFKEGWIDDTTTPKPGTVMEIDWSVAINNGRFTWEPYGTTDYDAPKGVENDGDQRLIAVLLPDELRGKTPADAYAAGERCFLYVPANGEELNMIVEDVSGTGDDHAVGDYLMVDDGTGKLLAADADAESNPFILLENIVNPMADTLAHVMYTGH